MTEPATARAGGRVDLPRASERPLSEVYDVALLDLDGVVYLGRAAVPGAPEALAEARHRGMRLAFVTNNASRSSAAPGCGWQSASAASGRCRWPAARPRR